MAMSLYARALVAVCDAANTYESLQELSKPENERGLTAPNFRFLSCANKFGVSLCFAIDCIARASGASNEALRNIKELETLLRLPHIGVRFYEEAKKMNEGRGSLITLLEKGVIAPVADFIRCGTESVILENKQWIEQLERGERPMRPEYEFDDDEFGGIKSITQVPVSLDECKENIKRSTEIANSCAKIRVISEFQILSTSFNRFAELKDYLTDIYDKLNEPANYNFLSLSYIPDPLHDDIVFSIFICPITGDPIRDPVGDPTDLDENGDPRLYERDSLLEYLGRNAVSPKTEKPLEGKDLIEQPNTLVLIEHRLSAYQEHFDEFLQGRSSQSQQVIPPPSPTLVAAAKAENSRYF